METYLVGGAVRDKLLGLPVTERDWVVVGATPEEMLAQGYQQVGKDFPVFLHPETREEYALARTERKVAPGYTGFCVYSSPDVSLQEDLKRRDLTINAMAETAEGELIDPYNGAADLRDGLLRHVSTAFTEDPVRILRVARFAARFNFKVAPDTIDLIRTMVSSGEVDALVAERVWAELERALKEQHPEAFFGVLRQCGALAKLFPELNKLFGVPQSSEHHPEVDAGLHSMQVLQQAARLTDDNLVRFAALLHDLGKADTPPSEWPHHNEHEKRGGQIVKNLCQRLRCPNDYRDLAVLVARYHLRCHHADELRPVTLLDTLEALDAFRRPERFEQFLLACKADHTGRPGREHNTYPQADVLRSALKRACDVDTTALVNAGLTGAVLAQALHNQRIAAITQLKSAG